MKTIIIYDSVFGNTEKAAFAIRDALGGEAVRVGNVSPDMIAQADMIIVGSPTRGFRPTKAITAFLSMVGGEIKGKKVSAFDTRISELDVKSSFLLAMMRIFGYAAEPIAKKLMKKGGRLVRKPLGVIVNDANGPLRDGELARIKAWVLGWKA